MMDGQNQCGQGFSITVQATGRSGESIIFVNRESLDPCVGMVFVEITQPTPTNVAEFGMLAVGVDRTAHRVEQVGQFSEKVARVAERLRRKGKVHSVQLPSLEGTGIPVHAAEEIGLRLVRLARE